MLPLAWFADQTTPHPSLLPRRAPLRARRAGRPRDRAGLDLAGRRPGPAAVLLRRARSGGSRAAPRHRHRRSHGDGGALAGRRNGHLRRNCAVRRQDAVLAEHRRALRDAVAPRFVRRRSGRRGEGGPRRRNRRSQRRLGAHGPVRLPGCAPRRGSPGLPGPAPFLARAFFAASRVARNGPGARAGFSSCTPGACPGSGADTFRARVPAHTASGSDPRRRVPSNGPARPRGARRRDTVTHGVGGQPVGGGRTRFPAARDRGARAGAAPARFAQAGGLASRVPVAADTVRASACARQPAAAGHRLKAAVRGAVAHCSRRTGRTSRAERFRAPGHAAGARTGARDRRRPRRAPSRRQRRSYH